MIKILCRNGTGEETDDMSKVIGIDLGTTLHHCHTGIGRAPVSYTHLRAHETDSYLVCRLLLEKKKKK